MEFDLKINALDTFTDLVQHYFTDIKEYKIVHSALDLMSLLFFTNESVDLQLQLDRLLNLDRLPVSLVQF